MGDETRRWALDSGGSSGLGEVRAWEARRYEVDVTRKGPQFPHIGVDSRLWEARSKYCLGRLPRFAKQSSLKVGTECFAESGLNATDSCEQTCYAEQG